MPSRSPRMDRTGPRREFKPGVVAAAQRGGGTVVPLHAEAESGVATKFVGPISDPQARSAGCEIGYGRPFDVAPGDEGLERGLADAVERLGEIAGIAE